MDASHASSSESPRLPDPFHHADPSHHVNRPRRIVVIGAGVTGLSAAFRLGELAQSSSNNVRLTVIEKHSVCGGLIGSEHCQGYLLDVGADSFITNKPAAVNLCDRIGLGHRLIPTARQFRGALVLRKGQPVPVPDGFMLMSPSALLPMLKSPILSWPGKLRMCLELLIPRRNPPGDESLAAFVRRRFGRETLDRLVQPLVGGIYTSDPEKLSLAATMPRFLDDEQKFGSLIQAARYQAQQSLNTSPGATAPAGSGARYGLFAGLAGGMQELVDKLRELVSQKADLILETAITGISQNLVQGGYQLELSNGERLACDGIVLTTPAYTSANMLLSFNPALAAELKQIEYASSAIILSGHRSDEITHPLNAFGLVIPAIEKRRILAVSFASRKFPDRAPPGEVQLRTFLGGAMQPELLEKTDEELVAILREELRDLLGVKGEPRFTKVVRYPRAMPQYHLGHLDRIARIDALVEQHSGFALAGSAYRGVGLPDCIANAEEAAERVFNAIAPTPHTP